MFVMACYDNRYSLKLTPPQTGANALKIKNSNMTGASTLKSIAL